MTRYLICLLAYVLFSLQTYAQNLNGKLDDLSEFSSKITVPFTMPDGIHLQTDVFVPVLQDCLVVDIPNSVIADIPTVGPVLAPLLPSKISIELLRRGTQIFEYDSIWDKNQNKYVPNPNPQQLPLVFTRTPYNKRGDIVGQIVSIMGYAYALQDMRGRYSSEGVYFPMYSDSWRKDPYHPNYAHILDVTNLTDPKNSNFHEDGYNSIRFILDSLYREYDLNNDGIIDTVDKMCNGSVGMFGASALGNTQYQAAAAHYIDPTGPGLKCLLPIVATNEHYRFTGFQNGVFRERIVTGWLKGQIFDVEDDSIDIDVFVQDALHTSADYNLTNQFDAASLAIDHFVEIQYNGSPAGYYPNSLGRVDMDASRAFVDVNGEGDANGQYSRYRNMEVPQYHLSGWWDIFVDGQIETYNQLMRHLSDTYGNKQKQKLVIGPWAHQTIGSTETGDMTYDENVADIIGINVGDIDINELEVSKVASSEIISWFRYNLNYNSYKNIGLPTAIIPESPVWQDLSGNGNVQIRIPSKDYRMSFEQLMNLLLGKEDLKNVTFEVKLFGGAPQQVSIDLAASDIFDGPLLPELVGSEINVKIDSVNFSDVPNVRYYVVGPNDDGIAANAHVGNYWKSSDVFPVTEGIQWQDMYIHKNGTLNFTAPTTDEGFSTYVHDPDDPVLTHGGGNMIVKTPNGSKDSQGQMDFSDPNFVHLVMDRPGVLQFETDVIQDSLCIIGFPQATVYAKTNPGGISDGPTDTDFFIRILDEYPDGRQFFVVEGCVNARGRDYARALAELGPDDEEDVNVPFTNINIGQLYEYKFKMMPIAYTFGKGHKMKVLISSSNYNRYQVNPNLPLEPGEFFRRQPGDGQTYRFQGVDMAPRVAVQRIAHSPDHPTHISLPVYNKAYLGLERPLATTETLPVKVFPNPATDLVRVVVAEPGNYYVRVFDQTGRIVYNGTSTGEVTVDVSHLSNGLYFVEVTGANGKSRTIQKLSVL